MVGTILVAVLAANPSPSSWSWRFDTSAAPTVNVSNISGEIRIQPSATGGVTVEARARGEANRDAWRVEAREHGGEVRIRVCCGPCNSSGWSRDCPDAGVELIVGVPARSSLDVSSVNAAVRIRGILGDQQISTVAGPVESTGSEDRLKISAVSARVALHPRVLGKIAVSSVSGPVRLQLPHGAGAEVSFSSVGGRFNGEGVAFGSITRTFGDGRIPVEVSTVGGELTVDAQG